jgi:hypothetical protein
MARTYGKTIAQKWHKCDAPRLFRDDTSGSCVANIGLATPVVAMAMAMAMAVAMAIPFKLKLSVASSGKADQGQLKGTLISMGICLYKGVKIRCSRSWIQRSFSYYFGYYNIRYLELVFAIAIRQAFVGDLAYLIGFLIQIPLHNPIGLTYFLNILQAETARRSSCFSVTVL